MTEHGERGATLACSRVEREQEGRGGASEESREASWQEWSGVIEVIEGPLRASFSKSALLLQLHLHFHPFTPVSHTKTHTRTYAHIHTYNTHLHARIVLDCTAMKQVIS